MEINAKQVIDLSQAYSEISTYNANQLIDGHREDLLEKGCIKDAWEFSKDTNSEEESKIFENYLKENPNAIKQLINGFYSPLEKKAFVTLPLKEIQMKKDGEINKVYFQN